MKLQPLYYWHDVQIVYYIDDVSDQSKFHIFRFPCNYWFYDSSHCKHNHVLVG